MNRKRKGYALIAFAILVLIAALSTANGDVAAGLGQGYIAFALSNGRVLGGMPFGFAVFVSAVAALVGTYFMIFNKE